MYFVFDCPLDVVDIESHHFLGIVKNVNDIKKFCSDQEGRNETFWLVEYNKDMIKKYEVKFLPVVLEG